MNNLMTGSMKKICGILLLLLPAALNVLSSATEEINFVLDFLQRVESQSEFSLKDDKKFFLGSALIIPLACQKKMASNETGRWINGEPEEAILFPIIKSHKQLFEALPNSVRKTFYIPPKRYGRAFVIVTYDQIDNDEDSTDRNTENRQKTMVFALSRATGELAVSLEYSLIDGSDMASLLGALPLDLGNTSMFFFPDFWIPPEFRKYVKEQYPTLKMKTD